jgi:hypothetical protein
MTSPSGQAAKSAGKSLTCETRQHTTRLETVPDRCRIAIRMRAQLQYSEHESPPPTRRSAVNPAIELPQQTNEAWDAGSRQPALSLELNESSSYFWGSSMQSFRECIGHELIWMQRHTLVAHKYELRNGQETAATLRFRSAFGSLATGECAEGCWTFKRVGFFRTRATARACGTDNDIAEFKNNTWSSGGTIAQVDGTTFQASTNFWSSKYDIASATGDSLIHYESRFGILNPKRVIVIQPSAMELDQLPWLALFGWYLLVMLQSDAAAAAAGA